MAWYVAIYDAVVHSAVAGFVLLGLATAALATIRQPARRIRVIEMTLVALLALPFLALIPGYPRVAVLPKMDSGGDDENAHGDALMVAQRNEKHPPAEPRAFAPMREMPAVKPPASPGDSAESSPGASRAGNLPAAPIAHPQRGETVRWQLPRDFRFWIVTGYLAGTGAMIVWSLVGLAAMARLLRSAGPAGKACHAVFREIAGPKSAHVALLVSHRAGQPWALVWGRPTIVLPEVLAAGGDERQLRFALAHEWSHIERGDAWTWGLSSVVRSFYFYQPLLWPLRRQLRLCQDYLADAAAARAGTAAEDYAEFLTSYSSGLKHPNLAAGLGIAGRASDLHRRIVMLVDNRRALERAVPRRWNLVALPLAVLLVALVTSLGSRPVEGAAEPPAAGSEDDLVAPPPDSADPPAAKAEPGPQPASAQRQAVAAEDPFAAEPNPPSVAAPQPGARPSEKVIDAEVEKDPFIVELWRRLAGAQVSAQALAPEVESSPESRKEFERLQREIRAIEQFIDERKLVLRPRVLEILAANALRAASAAVPPFSGHLRAGDILKIDLAGGFPTGTSGPTTATVEPDGNLALGVLYGHVNVAGKTLGEAASIIREHLLKYLMDPQVQVTYEGHNPDIVPAGSEPISAAAGRLQHLETLAKKGYVSADAVERQRIKVEADDKHKTLTSEIEALRAANAEMQRKLKELEKAQEQQRKR